MSGKTSGAKSIWIRVGAPEETVPHALIHCTFLRDVFVVNTTIFQSEGGGQTAVNKMGGSLAQPISIRCMRAEQDLGLYGWGNVVNDVLDPTHGMLSPASVSSAVVVLPQEKPCKASKRRGVRISKRLLREFPDLLQTYRA